MAYYEKSYSYGISAESATDVGRTDFCGATDFNGDYRFNVPFKVTKISVPTLTFYSNLGVVNKWKYYRNGASADVVVVNDLSNEKIINAKVPTGAALAITSIDGHWVADARI